MIGDALSWTVRCTLRGPLVPPFAEELIEDALAPTQTGAIVTVLQRALARLVCAHSADLVGTRFEFYSGLDEQSTPVPPRPHPTFGNHVAEMGLFVEYTQSQLITSRMESDLHRLNHDDAEIRASAAELKIEDLQTQLQASQEKLKAEEEKLKTSEERLAASDAEFRKERKERRCYAARFRTARFYQHQLGHMNDELRATIDTRDDRISELESEVEALGKQNDDLLPDDEDPMEGIDMEPESEQDDDDLRDEDDEDPEAVMSEDEDPDEPPFDSDATVDIE
jgi:hypothetical protein